MTLEERVQQLLGQQAFNILVLQTDLEKLQVRIAKLEKEREASSERNGTP